MRYLESALHIIYAHARMLIVGGRVLNRAFYVCYWRSHIEGAHEKSGAALAAPAATVPSPMFSGVVDHSLCAISYNRVTG